MLTVINNASSDIKWESTTSKAVGLDVAFLNNSLTGTAEYFIKNTDDILFAVPRSSSLGYGTTTPGNAIVNAASVENRGYEFQLGFRKSLKNFNFSKNANYTNITNKVTGLGAGQPYLDGYNRTAMGYPIGYLYGYVAQGVFMNQDELDAANQSARDIALGNNPALTTDPLSSIYYQYSTTSPGDVRFQDVDGDGKVTGEDRTMIGNSIPKNLYGFSFNFEYLGFDVNAFFQGIAGSYLYTQQYSFTRLLCHDW